MDESAQIEDVVERLQDGEKLSDIIDVSAASVDALETAAGRLFEQKKFPEAMVVAKGIAALDRDRYYPYLLTGMLHARRDQTEQAIEALVTAKELGPESAPELTFELGRALLDYGDPEAGVAQLQETLDRCDSEEDEAYRTRAESLLDEVQ